MRTRKAWLTSAAVLIVGLLWLMAGRSTGADERVVMRVSPKMAFAPVNLIVRATVARDDANRAIEIVAESDSFYRSSEVDLDGARAPQTTQFEFRNLPEGEYAVIARVKGVDGHELAVAHATVNVFDVPARER